MPGLTAETGVSSSPPQTSQQHESPRSPTFSRSSSPVQPPYSPITPVLSAARLATAQTPANSTSTSSSSHERQPVSRVYTHSQPPQTFIPHPRPPPETVSLDSNPDALALKSAISILQIQRQKALTDIRTLQKIKERGVADPAAFSDALLKGELKTQPDTLFGLHPYDNDYDEAEDEEAEDQGASLNNTTEGSPASLSNGDGASIQKWPHLPRPQDIIRTPPINWTQYGIMGESLDKLHADQVARPLDGHPAKIGPDGHVFGIEGGVRRTDVVSIAAPYMPGKDRLEKMGTRKGGKR